MDHALARGLVQLPTGGAQRGLGLRHVPSVRRLAELADGRAQRRLDGLVPLARLLVLLVALDLRLYVRHAWKSFKVSGVMLPKFASGKEPAEVAARGVTRRRSLSEPAPYT